MPSGANQKVFVVCWNDSLPLKKCERDVHKFRCGHENVYIWRCNDHAGKPEVEVAGYAYCAGELPFHNGVERE